MRYTFILACLAVLALSSACGNGNNNAPPSSQIVVRDATNDATLSTSEDKGSLSVGIGQTRTINVIRIVDDDGTIVESNVTAEADFNLSNPSVAAISASGVITGLALGFTEVIVKFRDEDNPDIDPSDTDEVDFDLTISLVPGPTT